MWFYEPAEHEDGFGLKAASTPTCRNSAYYTRLDHAYSGEGYCRGLYRCELPV